MPARNVAQLGIDEKVVDYPELISALEERQAARLAKGEATKAFKTAHAAAATEIEKLELPEGVAVRAGAFRITRSPVSARSVSFETNPTSRLSISYLGGDGDGAAEGDGEDEAE